jgi:polyisoprenoid-binding protein YceI
MKLHLLKTASLAIVLAFSIAACDKAPEGDNAKVGEQQQAAAITGQTYTVDTAASRIRFVGNGVGKNHPGIFKLSSGTVAVENDKITGGQFTIDINSIKLEQQEGPIQNKLRPHLLSGDFFDVAKFNTAKFEITSVAPYSRTSADSSVVEGANFNVSGNFTLKDVTKNITFPARIDLDANTLKARGNFDIDRTQWNMNYRSDKSIGDAFISETVNIELDLQAKK